MIQVYQLYRKKLTCAILERLVTFYRIAKSHIISNDQNMRGKKKKHNFDILSNILRNYAIKRHFCQTPQNTDMSSTEGKTILTAIFKSKGDLEKLRFSPAWKKLKKLIFEEVKFLEKKKK